MDKLEQKSLNLIKKFTKGKKHLKLNIGFLIDNKTTSMTFDETGEIDFENHIYEIGSLTKTFTASLLAKYVYENKMSLNDPINKYIPELVQDKYYPSLLKLATHTSGYPSTYPFSKWENFKMLMDVLFCSNKMKRQNPLNMEYAKMLELIKKSQVKDKEYKPEYSNFGVALLGNVIGSVSGSGYLDTMEDFLKNELKLQSTFLGTNKDKNLNGYNSKNENCGNWKWENNNLLIAPAGALSSTAEDLLVFAKANVFEEKPYFALCHQEYAKISKNESVGLAWGIEKKDIYNHMGATGTFFSYLAFNKNKKNAIVLLSNYKSDIGLLIKIINLITEELKK